MKTTPMMILAATLAALGGAALAQGQGNGPMAGFVQEWDMNADGRVTLADFAERRTTQFHMFDLNGDARIDAQEQANMAQTIAGAQDANHGGEGGHGQGGNGPGGQIHAAMTADYADADRDGILSAEEWADATQRLFTELDRSGDGLLNRADFGRHG